MKRRKIYDRNVYLWLREHPCRHIPAIFDIQEDDGTLLIREEYIRGDTLEGLMKKGDLPERERLRILLEICDGLDYLHHAEPPVIHRDIKASNVMIDTEGNVFIIDYDAARQYRPGAQRDTILIGTEGSAAPEQYGFRQSDARTDIYAVGILMRQMFPDNPAILRIAEKAVRMDPDRRYQTVRKLKMHISDYMNRNRRPPGFRTGKPLRMILALAGYFVAFMLVITLEVQNPRGPGDILLNRIAFGAAVFGLIDLFADITHIYRRFPLLTDKNIWIRIVGYSICAALTIFIPVTVLVILESFLY